MAGAIIVEAGNLRARFWQEEGRLRHSIDVRRGSRWRAFLVSGGAENSDERISVLDFLELAQPPTSSQAAFQAHLDDVAVGLRASAMSPGVLYMAADLRLRLPSDFSRFCQTYEIVWPIDYIWAPQLAPQPGDLIGQHAFRTPGIAMQAGELGLCVIPDLDLIETTWTKMPVAMEIDADPRLQRRPTIAYGCMNYRARDEAFTGAIDEPTTFVFRDVMSFGWYVIMDENCRPGEAWRLVLKFCWDKWGQKLAGQLRPQVVSWDKFAEAILPLARELLWTTASRGGETRGGIVTGHVEPPAMAPAPKRWPSSASRRQQANEIERPTPRWPNDIWFSCRDNDLFTALGLKLWGDTSGDAELCRRAEAIKNLVLSAPRDRGFFPTVYWFRFVAGQREEHWAASNFYGGGDNVYATADMSWTAELMLRWFEMADPDPRLVEFAEEYGWALMDIQAPCGAIPAWVRVADLRPDPRLAESIHTAASALLLAHLARTVGEDDFLTAALAAEKFIREQLIPQRQFGDFEQFFDAPALPLGFYDPRTRQYPQGTMGLFWTVEMYRALYEATGEEDFLGAARLWADYLALWQCIWDPPFFSTQVRGGFSSSNCQLRWCDPRAALFAVGYARLYQLVGDLQLLQRAVMAARSAFVTVFCADNEPVAPRCFDAGPTGLAASGWGVGCGDAPYPVAGFDWGSGSAMAAAAILRHWFGDLFIDAKSQSAVGINGLVAAGAAITAQAARVEIAEAAELRRLLVRAEGFPPEATVTIEIAGAIEAQAEATGARLQEGLWLSLSP